MPKKWVKLPLSLPLKTDYATDVVGADGGGALSAMDVDLRSKKGSVLARKQDLQLYGSPPLGNVIRDIAQETDPASLAKPIAILTSNTPTGNINGFYVRGFKTVTGEELSADWVAPPVSINTPEAVLQHDGNEVRIHCATPMYYGLPRSISEATTDWRFYDKEIIEPTEFLIDRPFAEANDLRAPTVEEIGIVICNNENAIGQFDGSAAFPSGWGQAMWGAAEAGNTDAARFRYAYFAVSYLYDGYQESPLCLLPDIGDFHRDTDSDTRIFWTAWADLIFKGTILDVGQHSTSIPRRVRKVRLYCAPSLTVLGSPLKEGTFYLAAEIDVSEWDKKSPHRIYGGSATLRDPDASPASGGITYWLKVDDEWIQTTYDSSSFYVRIEGFTHQQCDASHAQGPVTFPLLADAAPFFKIGENEAEFAIAGVMGKEQQSPNTDSIDFSQEIYLKVSPADEAAVRQAFAEQEIADHARVDVYCAFRWYVHGGNAHPGHRSFIGQEVLLRPTYEQLSGLPQYLEGSVSPPRIGGCHGAVRHLIWGPTDKDGKQHRDWVQWCDYSPAGILLPDRYDPDKRAPLNFSVLGVQSLGESIVVFGENNLVTGRIGGDEEEWTLTDVRGGVGAKSRQSIANSPFGLICLSNDGVRVIDRAFFTTTGGAAIISGAIPSDILSEDIRSEILAQVDGWSTAVGFYDSRTNRYVIHFPTTRKTYVFDFAINGWLEISNSTPFYAAHSGADGHAIMGKYDTLGGGALSGVWQYSASDDDVAFPQYSLKLVGNPLADKYLRHIRAWFTDTEGGAFAVQIMKESDSSVAAPSLTSGQVSHNLHLRDRGFTFSFSGFSELKAVFVEIEETDRDGVNMAEE